MISMDSTATKEIAMDVIAYERWTETEGDDAELFAHEMLRRDVYSLGEEALVFCPVCEEMAEDFVQIYH
jgi:hypothetical protein